MRRPQGVGAPPPPPWFYGARSHCGLFGVEGVGFWVGWSKEGVGVGREAVGGYLGYFYGRSRGADVVRVVCSHVLVAGLLFTLRFVHSLVGGLWVLAWWEVIVGRGAFVFCAWCGDRFGLGSRVE